jgi:cysteine desulfurase
MKQPVYLDYNATTPIHPQVAEAMMPYFTDYFGNPSSNHAYGFRLRKAIDEAREQIASFIGAQAEEIIFTSCGSESNNLAIKGTCWALANRGNHIVISAVEHPAVARSAGFLEREGFRVTRLSVDSCGRVDPAELAESITARTILISIIHGQNEIGTIQPIREIAAIARERGVVLHTDAAQTVGKIPVDVNELGIDLLTMAGNKFYAPKGAAALFVRGGARLEPLIHGGGQQDGLRAGTENAAFAVALGQSALVASSGLAIYQEEVKPLRDLLHKRLLHRIPDAILNGHPEHRLPNTLNLSFPGVDSSALLNSIRDSVACSTGSGCHAGRSEPSTILLAIGRDPALACAALRLSLGAETRQEEIEEASDAIAEGVLALRSM